MLEYGIQVLPEVGVVFHLLVSNFDILSFLDGESAQQRIQNSIHTLSNVLQEKSISVGHGSLYCIQITVHIKREVDKGH